MCWKVPPFFIACRHAASHLCVQASLISASTSNGQRIGECRNYSRPLLRPVQMQLGACHRRRARQPATRRRGQSGSEAALPEDQLTPQQVRAFPRIAAHATHAGWQGSQSEAELRALPIMIPLWLVL